MSMSIKYGIYRLKLAAEGKGHILYNICFRVAGVGIMWHEPRRQKSEKDWRSGLYVDRYYDDLETAIKAEVKRLWEK